MGSSRRMLPPRTVELLNSAIKPSLRPADSEELSGVVLFHSGAQIKCYYIKFDDSVIHQLGRKMPYGVGKAHPAYLEVKEVDGRYAVVCHYLNSGVRRMLWVQDEKPIWLKYVGRVIDGKSTGQSAGS